MYLFDEVPQALGPRNAAWTASLRLAGGDVHGAEVDLVELIAWLAFDRPKTPPKVGSAMRVLVVDDLEESADMQCMLLQQLGYITKAVYTGKDAIEGAKEFAPDVVLLDRALPDLCGYIVARALRMLSRPPLVVMVTGDARPDTVEQALRAGCVECLFKPVNRERLQRVFARVTGGHDINRAR